MPLRDDSCASKTVAINTPITGHDGNGSCEFHCHEPPRRPRASTTAMTQAARSVLRSHHNFTSSARRRDHDPRAVHMRVVAVFAMYAPHVRGRLKKPRAFCSTAPKWARSFLLRGLIVRRCESRPMRCKTVSKHKTREMTHLWASDVRQQFGLAILAHFLETPNVLELQVIVSPSVRHVVRLGHERGQNRAGCGTSAKAKQASKHAAAMVAASSRACEACALAPSLAVVLLRAY